jgi:hypothetical protein
MPAGRRTVSPTYRECLERPGTPPSSPSFSSGRIRRWISSPGRCAPPRPRNWRDVQLELKVSRAEGGQRYKIAHRILNPDTGAEAIDFSDQLFALIDVYHRIDLEVGYNWNRSTLTLFRSGKIEAKYEYGPVANVHA